MGVFLPGFGHADRMPGINEVERLRSIGIKLAAFCARLSGTDDVPSRVQKEAIELAKEFTQVVGK